MRINLKSYYKEKNNIKFITITLALTIILSIILNINKNLDSIEIDQDSYLIMHNISELKEGTYELQEISKEEYSNYFDTYLSNDLKKYDKVYQIRFNKISLYNKYEEKSILISKSQKLKDKTITYKYYSVVLKALTLMLIIIYLLFFIYNIKSEKDNINLLKILNYKRYQIFITYLINYIPIILVNIIIFYILNHN